MEHYPNGSWKLNLNGICYRELWELSEMLAELAEKGNVGGVELDLSTLYARFDANLGTVELFDEDGNTTEEMGDL